MRTVTLTDFRKKALGFITEVEHGETLFAKRYIQEVGSDKLDDFLQQASELALWVISVPELISALNRR